MPRSCPRGVRTWGGGGGAGGPKGVKKLFFSNVAMWHIKLTGSMSRTKCKFFHPRVKLVTLG